MRNRSGMPGQSPAGMDKVINSRATGAEGKRGCDLGHVGGWQGGFRNTFYRDGNPDSDLKIGNDGNMLSQLWNLIPPYLRL